MRTLQAAPDTLWSILTGMARSQSLEPGDEVALAAAEYDQPVELAAPGVTIRSAEPRAPATLRAKVRLSGDRTQLRAVEVRDALDINGNGTVVERVKVVPKPGQLRAIMLARGTGQVLRFVEITGHEGRGISIDGSSRKPHIYRCWIHGQKPIAGELAGNIGIGGSKATMFDEIEALVEECLIEDTTAFQGIEMKSSKNTILRCTTIGADIFVRHGNGNRIIACEAIDGMIGSSMNDTLIADCKVSGQAVRSPACIAARAGTMDGPTSREGSGDDSVDTLDSDEDGEHATRGGNYYRAVRTRIVRPEGLTVNGWRRTNNWTKHAVATVVEAAAGEVDNQQEEKAKVLPDSDVPVTARIKLTREMVGPGGEGESGPVGPDGADAGKIAKALQAARKTSGDLDDRIRAIRKASSNDRKQAEDVALDGLVALRTVVKEAATKLRALEATGLAAVSQIALSLETARRTSGDLDDKIRAIRKASSGGDRKQAEDVALAGLVALRTVVKEAATKLGALE